MADNLIDIAVPGLGSTLQLLCDLKSQYDELAEGKELCIQLHLRMKEFAEVVTQMGPGILEVDSLVLRLKILIHEFTLKLASFKKCNLVQRIMKMNKFQEDVEIYNGRLDQIVKMITVTHTEKLARLLQWRVEYETNVVSTNKQLTEMHDLTKQIWTTLNDMHKNMTTKRDIEDMVLVVKRDLSEASNPEHTRQPLEKALGTIVKVAEKKFLEGKALETPPSWLIAADEVVISTEPPIDSEGATCIHKGKWHGTTVAVKKFHAAGESPVFNKHFQVWRNLLHPNVAQLYGAGSDKGIPFFVYEFAGLESLDRCWGQLTEEVIWQMLHQASLGLLYLFRKQIVHGNLDCTKFLVTEQGTLKLFGFGASYLRQNNNSNSMKSTVNEEFAAPECIGIGPRGIDAGSRHSPSFESDVYSLGLTIVAAITKKDPFAGMSTREIRNAKRSFLPQPPELSDEAYALVKQMCDCDPDQRISIAAVVEQLQYLANRQGGGNPSNEPDRGRPFVPLSAATIPSNATFRQELCSGLVWSSIRADYLIPIALCCLSVMIWYMRRERVY